MCMMQFIVNFSLKLLREVANSSRFSFFKLMSGFLWIIYPLAMLVFALCVPIAFFIYTLPRVTLLECVRLAFIAMLMTHSYFNKA